MNRLALVLVVGFLVAVTVAGGLLFKWRRQGQQLPAISPTAATITPTTTTTTSQETVTKSGDTEGLDPALLDSGDQSQEIAALLYEGLFAFTPESKASQPALATSWENSADGKTVTVKLREGVKFHDGSPFDAEAVEASLGRQLREEHPLRLAGQVFTQWNDLWGTPGLIQSLEVVDLNTVRFTLTDGGRPITDYLAEPCCAIVSPVALKTYGEDFPEHPVGTGPYRVSQWGEEQLVLEANPDYWGTRASPSRIIYVPE